MYTDFNQIRYIDKEIHLFGGSSNIYFADLNQVEAIFTHVILSKEGQEISYFKDEPIPLDSYVNYPGAPFLIDNNSNYIIAGSEWKLEENEVRISPTILSRNQDLEINWKNNLRGFTFRLNGLTDIFLASDDTYIVNGDYMQRDVNDEFILRGSILSKVSQEGEEIWARIDSFPGLLALQTINYMTKTVELSSGSLMSCGYIKTFDTGIHAGTLWKFDKNGRMNGDCENVVLDVEELLTEDIKIGPIPMQDNLKLHAHFSFAYKLFGSSGQLITESMDDQHEFDVRTIDLLNGIYYIQLRVGNEAKVKGKVKVK